MVFNIDLDRGVLSRSDPDTGMDIFMYHDKPGVFLSAHGSEVSIELARRAGFEVDKLLRERHIKEAVKAAQDKVLAEMDEADRGERVVVAEKGDFKIIDIGYDRYQVLSPDGDVLSPKPMNKREAVILLDQLVPDADPEVEPKEEESKPAKSAKKAV